MKNILLLLLLISTTCFSQIEKVSILYNLVIGQDELYSNGELKNSYNLAIENAKNLKYNLNINKNEVCFFLENEKQNIDSGIELAKIFSGSKNPLYMDIKSNIVYQSFDDLILGKYTLKKERVIYNWKFEKETKIIAGFKCYKATTNDIVENSNGTFSFLVTAWYCPEIPISIGPLFFNGLPGLILELNRRNVVYGAIKIELNPEKEPLILKPNLNIIRTEIEINKMKEDFLNSKD